MVVDLQTANFLPELNEIKIVVVGARKVGKSASVVRFLTNRFINEYCENTDMNCPGRVEIDGSSLNVNILDTSDKGMRTASVEHSIRWADAIIFVYSVTDRESFDALQSNAVNLVSRMQQENKTNDGGKNEAFKVPPLLLIGNKSDLDFVRQVSQQEGYDLANKLLCEFYEASARDGWSQQIELHSDPSPRRKSDSIHKHADSLKYRSLTPQPLDTSLGGSSLKVPKVKRSSSFQGIHTRASSSTDESKPTDFSMTLPAKTSFLTPTPRSLIKRMTSPLIRRKSSKNEFQFDNISHGSPPVISGLSESLSSINFPNKSPSIDSNHSEARIPQWSTSSSYSQSLSSNEDLIFDEENSPVKYDDRFPSCDESPKKLSVQIRKYQEPFMNLMKKVQVNRLNSKSRSLMPPKMGRVSPTSFFRSGFKRIRSLGSSSDGNKITNFANSMSTPRTDKMSNVIKGNVF